MDLFNPIQHSSVWFCLATEGEPGGDNKNAVFPLDAFSSGVTTKQCIE